MARIRDVVKRTQAAAKKSAARKATAKKTVRARPKPADPLARAEARVKRLEKQVKEANKILNLKNMLDSRPKRRARTREA